MSPKPLTLACQFFAGVIACFSLSLSLAFAAVDVNQASEAELDGLKGLGPATTRLILAERQRANFINWSDLIARVKGLGPKSAASLSAAGLTVGGKPYQPNAAQRSLAP
jgi:competence protein ComEA